jgi:Zn ribbon nucleic-acid-binding protein
MKLVDGNTETWECRICGHKQVIHTEVGVFPSNGYPCPKGCRAKVERQFFEPWDVRLLKAVPAGYHMKHLDVGMIVKAEIFPDGKIYLMHPSLEVPTAFNVNAVEGVDFEEMEAKS